MLFQCRISNALDDLPRVLDGLEATGLDHCWPPVFQMQLTLVIEELMVNAINYGGRKAGQGWVEVRVETTINGVCITIEDNGLAFNPFSVATPDTALDLDCRNIGGLGVHFVREMTESHRYERSDEINRVILFKKFACPD